MLFRPARPQTFAHAAILGALLPFAACKGGPAGPAAPPPPVEVGVVTLATESVLLTTELPGRTSAYEASEVRPQVSGVIRERLFTEGQMVHKGQTLYQIDARLYRAALAQARANLASAEAQREAARARATRYEPLAKIQAVSALDYADAKAGAEQAAAAVEQAQAALETARINLRFSEVPAPIDGRIGRSLVTTGALVTESQAAPLATIQRLDPIYVDLQESSADLLALRRSLAAGHGLAASTDVRLLLEDGSEYDRVGHLEFAEALVDPNTGAVTLRARFDNPDSLLLPGMYVRAVVGRVEHAAAILAPQPGVLRDPRGNATVFLVGPEEKVIQRSIEARRVVANQWLVEKGLAAGDRLIVEGTDKVRPGQVVKAVSIRESEPVPAGPHAEQ